MKIQRSDKEYKEWIETEHRRLNDYQAKTILTNLLYVYVPSALMLCVLCMIGAFAANETSRKDLLITISIGTGTSAIAAVASHYLFTE